MTILYYSSYNSRYQGGACKMLEKVLSFLFGQEAKIFAEDGTVQHELPKNRWDAWKKRYTSSPEYNWKNHAGTKAGGTTHSKR